MLAQKSRVPFSVHSQTRRCSIRRNHLCRKPAESARADSFRFLRRPSGRIPARVADIVGRCFAQSIYGFERFLCRALLEQDLARYAARVAGFLVEEFQKRSTLSSSPRIKWADGQTWVMRANADSARSLLVSRNVNCPINETPSSRHLQSRQP